jgi:hypothetical protein
VSEEWVIWFVEEDTLNMSWQEREAKRFEGVSVSILEFH